MAIAPTKSRLSDFYHLRVFPVIPPQAFLLLTVLLKSAGEVVTREELRKRLWSSEELEPLKECRDTQLSHGNTALISPHLSSLLIGLDDRTHDPYRKAAGRIRLERQCCDNSMTGDSV